MHTIDGTPAFFDGWQISYGVKYSPHKHNILSRSLKQIRAEQKLTKKNREFAGFDFNVGEYGYLVVYGS
jgi:hypothetical protein